MGKDQIKVQKVIALKGSGKTFAEIGEALNISRQRAHQLFTREVREGNARAPELPAHLRIKDDEVYCTVCKTIGKKHDDKFYLSEARRKVHICRSCNTQKSKQRRKGLNGKNASLRAITKYEANNPKRRIAWTLAAQKPLEPCEVCGEEKTHRHHPDVDKPLEVRHLCPLHHKWVHLGKIILPD